MTALFSTAKAPIQQQSEAEAAKQRATLLTQNPFMDGRTILSGYYDSVGTSTGDDDNASEDGGEAGTGDE